MFRLLYLISCFCTISILGSYCDGCTREQLTFGTRDDGSAIDVIPTYTTMPFFGCLSVTANCTADPGLHSYMQFNSVDGGPPPIDNQTSVALMKCINGDWVFSMYGISRVITMVTCDQAEFW